MFRRNEKAYDRLADHVGRFPAVMIAPADAVLIQEGSETRRRWIDSVISQFDREYLSQLMADNKALNQRKPCCATLPKTDGGMPRPRAVGRPALFRWRWRSGPSGRNSSSFVPGFLETYREITNGAETVSVRYTN